MKIINAQGNFEREPLLYPFGFKGRSVSELWQIAVRLQSESGRDAVGLGVQSPLWSDGAVFAMAGERAGNCLMYLVCEYALNLIKSLSFETPIDLMEKLLPPTLDYSRTITGQDNISKTFALNAMVPIDNAAWILYSRENHITSFDDMIPKSAKSALGQRAKLIANIPLITYNVPPKDIKRIIDEGYPVLKIKIGADPEKDGDKSKMLSWDQNRLSDIHNIAKDCRTPYTDSGNILYYLDANGQYPDKDTLMKFLEYAKAIGALERIVLLEEPFAEENKTDVHDVPVRLVADESAHAVKEARERIELGYGAIALKPIAKTLSQSFQIAAIAHEKNIPCFCADLTVNPVMMDWNKNVACRLKVLPGVKIAVVESNGFQNYTNWDKMLKYHPCAGAPWLEMKNGVFTADDDFYRLSGGIFLDSEHYSSLI